MDAEELAIRAIKLPKRLRLAFAAAAAEHIIQKIRHHLEEWGLDEIADKAIEKVWNVVEGGEVDADSIKASEDECAQGAPNTEDAPDAADLTYGLAVLSYACRVARENDVENNLRYLISISEAAIDNYSFYIHQDDRSLAELEQADPLEEARDPEVLEEGRYQTALLSTLEKMDAKTVDRTTLLNLSLADC